MMRLPDLQAALAETETLYRRLLDQTLVVIDEQEAVGEETLRGLLKERSGLLERLASIETGMFKAFGPEFLDAKGPTAEHPALLSEIRRLMGELIQADKVLRKHLEGRMEEAGSELRRTGRGHSALKGYSGYQSQGPVRVNRRG